MEFDLNAEEIALRDAARRFLEKEAPVSYARAMMDDERGFTDDVWRKMAGLGWMALPFPEDAGGVGQGFIALSILLAEMGRVVLPGPYFATVVPAAHAILLAGSEAQRKELLGGICAGEITAALAYDDAGNPNAVRASSDGRLTGEVRFIIDGAGVDRLVVAATTADGPGLFVTGREGVTATSAGWMDATRKAAHLRFEDAPAERLTGRAAEETIVRVVDLAAAGLAAEMLGACERVLELSVAYAKDRVQFDRPIGSFQAVKHRAADMLLDVESARNAVWYAAWALERDHQDAPLAASMAKAFVSDAARRVTASGIQIHGGIGFTWEHDMHLYFKRAKCSEALFGDAVRHRERMAQILRSRYADAKPL
jgi:alkylation response protein AidB-like acyl-CoA dehydrogenase